MAVSLHRSMLVSLTSFLVRRRVRARCGYVSATRLIGALHSSSTSESGAGEMDGDVTPDMKAKENRFRRGTKLRKNRRDAYLEKKARTGHLFIPLDKVQAEWRGYRGLDHLHSVGVHNRIFSDVFSEEFRPKGFLTVTYTDSAVVHHGNLLTPERTSTAPQVQLPHELRSKDGYASLLLTNPDGHLRDNSLEVLHWMVTNIHTQSDDISSGSVLMPYLQPLPPRGTGFHRFIFSLFTHSEPLSLKEDQLGLTATDGERGTWLDQRTFSTHNFLSHHPQLEPFTFALFQSQWDDSVHNTFSDVLGYPEPVYGLEKKVSTYQLKKMEVKRKRANKYRNM